MTDRPPSDETEPADGPERSHARQHPFRPAHLDPSAKSNPGARSADHDDPAAGSSPTASTDLLRAQSVPVPAETGRFRTRPTRPDAETPQFSEPSPRSRTPRPARIIAPPPLASDVERLGWAPAPRPAVRPRRRPSRLSQVIRVLFIIAILSTTAFAASHQALLATLAATPQWQRVELTSRNAVHAVVSVVAEEPSFAAAPELASYPICAGTGPEDTERLEAGMNLMRGTVEGERLFDQLVNDGICVLVEDINYNSGYAYGRQSPVDGSWSDSYIAVASDLLHSGETDVVAALLVHEATHIDRYVIGLACNYRDTCTTLPNGVDLEEEVAAHGAEAQWWIAAYGADGKRFATGYDYGLNRLARAYGEGPDVFDAYVRSVRSDAREGDAIAR